MSYIRQDVHGTSGQDILKINENFMNIFEKVFGDINYSDVDTELQKRINKQWIPVQGEGNLDSSNPLRIRFFIPPNTTKLVSTNFNVITENYRMDSSITDTQESKQEVISIVSSAAPKTTSTSTTAPQQSPTSSSATVGVSSVSNTTVGVSSVAGGGTTSDSGGGYVKYVRKWGPSGYEVSAPTDYIYPNNTGMVHSNLGGFLTSNDDRLTYGALIPDGRMQNATTDIKYIDLYSIQHSHEIPSHTHWVKGHSHDITIQPHSHTVTLQAHSHTVTIQPHAHDVVIESHTHEVTGDVTIPAHSHDLQEGVKTSTTSPSNVKFKINDTEFCTLDGNNTKNNIDITENIKIGEWNVIEISADTVARAIVYGTVELIAI